MEIFTSTETIVLLVCRAGTNRCGKSYPDTEDWYNAPPPGSQTIFPSENARIWKNPQNSHWNSNSSFNPLVKPSGLICLQTIFSGPGHGKQKIRKGVCTVYIDLTVFWWKSCWFLVTYPPSFPWDISGKLR